ncbi:hypothetical protein F2Q69_00003310 [Brassica cretica]|uniref:Uncharacterized protein n=1 Tax=Brassica cretica TaxID=69181 RepID=A0A8S9NZ85_BRACR|nr:hypothetical protein F2Q69_00003310 [Brassica cretica]
MSLTMVKEIENKSLFFGSIHPQISTLMGFSGILIKLCFTWTKFQYEYSKITKNMA